MHLSDFRTLFAYSHWASERLLTAAGQLSDEQWTRDLGSSFPSVRETFAHFLAAEWIWFRRWQGENPQRPPEWKDTASLARLREILEELHAERSRFLDTLSEDRLAAVVHFTFLSGTPGAQPLGSLMLHVVNHSTYHRGQVTTMLRQLGVAPPSTDLYAFNALVAETAELPA
jgi:uncharacterized damage-inducible protein DinB